ncbi:MAG: formimidoylglutamate deiminase [Gemmatimonadota bacterium]|nr:formimidoylglutamate deiminase [Gemmatimonadota bacterium]MDE2983762.1 formimidoylglutamate deiminase [Gemmatimonadota bacterium]
MSLTAAPRRAFRFERLLVGDRWKRDVRVEVDAGGRIASLEPGGSPDRCETVTGWAVPGVPNVHSHSFQRALAGLAEGRGPDSFWSWREVMYAFLERLTPGDVEAITAQLYIEMLKAGFTCVGEFHYLHHRPGGGEYDDPAEMSRRILAAARTAGIGLVHMPVVYERGGFGGEELVGGQRRFRLDLEGATRMREELEGDFEAAGAGLGWALHSLRAVSEETFGRVAGLVGGAGGIDIADGGLAGTTPVAVGSAPVHIHVAEQESEVRQCVAAVGARPVEWLLANAPVDERWCLVHATQVNREEIAAVAGCGPVVGLCPTTEANLGDGLFPLGEFARAGGRFAIGTDSHVSRSPVEELRLLEYGQRLVTKRRGGWGGGVGNESEGADRQAGAEGRAGAEGGGRDGVLVGAGGALLAHAWEGGCRALGWQGGRMEIGRRADVVVLDAGHPALVGREGAAVVDSWVFSGTENPVRDVMVGGNWVVRGGRHEREEGVAGAFGEVVKGWG